MSSARTSLIHGLSLLAVVIASRAGFAEEPVGGDEDKTSAKTVSPLRSLMDESLTWTELFRDSSSSRPMKPIVAMRWANNVRNSEDGMTVVYLAEGRPEAVCCIYPWEGQLVHEFDSLSRGTLVGRRNSQIVWSPQKPGLQFKPIPDAEPPADAPVARLRQMKEFAGRFSSTMLGWQANKSDREPLRLLPRPLYRYESTRSDVIDGAVFAFVLGTDPESLLLIEAFKPADGKGNAEWQFAFARRTSGELEGCYQDQVVWHADRYPENTNPSSIHRSLTRRIDPDLVSGSKSKDKSE